VAWVRGAEQHRSQHPPAPAPHERDALRTSFQTSKRFPTPSPPRPGLSLRPRPRDKQLGPPNGPCKATSPGGDLSGLQSFTPVQAPPLAWPPGCSHRQTSACLGRPGRIHQAELRVVTGPEHWYRYVPEAGNWHGGTRTRWIPSLSATPVPFTPFRPVGRGAVQARQKVDSSRTGRLCYAPMA
jgi:hypothetical protein